MSDRIRVDYVQLEQIMQQIRGVSDHLQQNYDQLLRQLREVESAWRGKAAHKFLDEMSGQVLPAYRRLTDALSQMQDTLGRVAHVMHTAEEQASQLFKGTGATGEFGAVGGMGGSAGTPVGGAGNRPDSSRIGSYRWLGLNPNGGFSFLSADDPYNRAINMGQYPSFLRNSMFPSQTEILRQYLAGDMDFKTAHEFLRFGRVLFSDDKSQALIDVGDTDRVLPNYLDASAKFEFFKIQDETTAFERIFGNENANLRFSALSFERELSGRLKLEPDKIDVGIEGSAGAYLARLQGSVEMNGFRAMGDAYIGATASGQASVIIDPSSGDAKVTLRGEAFMGAQAKGSIGFVNELFSVEFQGHVAAGVGGRGQFDVGIDNGRLKLDAGFLGAFGVGGGAGVKVDVNLNKTADITTEAVGDAFKGVGNFVSDVLGDKNAGNAFNNVGNLLKTLF